MKPSMKHCVDCLLILCLVALPCLSQTQAQEEKPHIKELVIGGDFEAPDTNDDQTNLPKGWGVWSEVKDHAIAEYRIVKDEKYQGQYSLNIHRLEPKGNSRVSPPAMIVESQQRLLISMYVKTTKGNPGIVLSFKDAKNKTISGMTDVSSPTKGAMLAGWGCKYNRMLLPEPDGFNLLEFYVTAPKEAARLNISLDYSHTTGDAWFDQVSVIPLN